jgi:hemerythrin
MASLIEWKDSYSVGVELIDEQHKKLFSHINDLYLAMKEARDKEIISGLLDRLADYASYHFTAEEKYFEEFGYEKKVEHIAYHKQYIEKIKSFQKNQNQSFLSYDIVDFLEDWILVHIATEDKKYTRCFNDHGLN